jgi:hypothetical protein
MMTMMFGGDDVSAAFGANAANERMTAARAFMGNLGSGMIRTRRRENARP